MADYLSFVEALKAEECRHSGPRPPPYICPTAPDPTEVLINLVLCEAVMLHRDSQVKAKSCNKSRVARSK
jgi:hypothetical protein